MPDGLQDAIARVGQRLRAVATTGGVDLALTAGEAVLDEVYGGDPERWRTGAPVSLRQLASATSLSASTLYRFVAVAAMIRALGRPRFQHLGLSHLRQVLPLPLADQRDLLEKAEAGRWTVARLAKATAGRLPEKPRARSASGFRRAFAHLERWVGEREHLEHLDHLRRLTPEESARMLRVVTTLQMDLEIIGDRLRLAGRPKRVA